MTAEIHSEKTAYQPGEEIKGTVAWTSQKPPRKAELRLFWQTRGKGDRDTSTVASVAFDLPRPSDQRAFSFRAPEFPPSFSGRLISLVWGLDLVLEPVGSEAIELVIAPAAQELSLERPEWMEIEVPEAAQNRLLRFGR